MTAPEQQAITIPPPEWTPTSSEYHSKKDSMRWSSSSLKDFRKSPALAWAKYIAKTIPPSDPSSSMIFGSLFHLMATQPERVEEEVVIVEAKTRGAKAFREADALHGRAKLVVTLPEWERAVAGTEWLIEPRKKSYAAVLAHRLLRGGEGFAEYAHQWDERGIPFQMMADRLMLIGGEPAIVELKTCQDPSPDGFARQVLNFEYHCQAALYLRGMTELLGVVPAYFWVAVHNDAPHEVAVYQISDDFLALGNLQLDQDLEHLAKCLELAPDIAWVADWEEPLDAIPHLIPPAWAARKLESSSIYDTF